MTAASGSKQVQIFPRTLVRLHSHQRKSKSPHTLWCIYTVVNANRNLPPHKSHSATGQPSKQVQIMICPHIIVCLRCHQSKSKSPHTRMSSQSSEQAQIFPHPIVHLRSQCHQRKSKSSPTQFCIHQVINANRNFPPHHSASTQSSTQIEISPHIIVLQIKQYCSLGVDVARLTKVDLRETV